MLTVKETGTRMGVPVSTIQAWLRQGRFPNAVREETQRGPVWMIPEQDLEVFVRPTMGRPVRIPDSKDHG